ncbi:hypothetical protein BDU57DRAFT_460267 [Ampelomyces quisqualis]|uniref:Amidohydrolase-related domain-containing protein n=1 Tax=Ampelomyces quisqualis TaxID=50730 RepID=A0A6A5Q957_AMPQU|nr:hypothetical protein BDU57DRAFT_460267 [Ampelomyces quisqualis]
MSTALPIACVESYINPSLPIGTSLSDDATAPALHLLPTPTLSKLKNVGSARVKDLRALGQSKQILSHIPIPATANAPTCTRFNDALFAGIKLNADKFAAMAILPIDGQEAARELQRCVSKMKFVGGVVGYKLDGTGGVSMGNDLENLWITAERYRVPIMLRDMWPIGSELSNLHAGLPDSVLAPIATHLHTSHNHSPLTIIHLYLSCVFDRHPSLRLILAHPCLLPSLLPRIETILAQIPPEDKPKRGFLDVWQHNFYLTTADVLDISTMRTLLEQIPIDRILYASNYPMEERGRELMEELRGSGFLAKEEWESLAWGNAELLFGFKDGNGKGKGKL